MKARNGSIMPVHPRVRVLDPIQLPPEPGEEIPRFLLRDPAQLTDNQLVLTLPALYLVELADGTRSVDELQRKMGELTGLQVEGSLIESLLAQLDESFLLDNERARHRLKEISPRPMRHAGGGYPSELEALKPFLDDLVGKDCAEPRDFVGASILPHIDFFRGRDAYRQGYRHLHGLAKQSLTVVILGISHAFCRTPFILTEKDFDTPYGPVKTDLELTRALAQNLPFDPFEDEYNHMAEHSVEFHAVLLRHLVGDECELKIVPILCRSFHEAVKGQFSPRRLAGVNEFLQNLEKLKSERQGLHFLASVDLAHMGVQFGGPPLSKDFLEELDSRDRESLRAVCEGDSNRFFATHQKDGGERNYCGTPAIFALLELFPQAFELHSYQQCTDPQLQSTVTVCSATPAIGTG